MFLRDSFYLILSNFKCLPKHFHDSLDQKITSITIDPLSMYLITVQLGILVVWCDCFVLSIYIHDFEISVPNNPNVQH